MIDLRSIKNRQEKIIILFLKSRHIIQPSPMTELSKLRRPESCLSVVFRGFKMSGFETLENSVKSQKIYISTNYNN